MRALGVIPARFNSSRLPGKPLEMIGNKTVLERVWKRALDSKVFDKVVIATDDDRIKSKAREFGADVIMTSSENQTGTDRVFEAYKLIDGEYDIIANIQGDMPFINPKVIRGAVLDLFHSDGSFLMGTVATPITDYNTFTRESVVKVLIGEDNRAIYFSRAPIPYWRDITDEDKIQTGKVVFGYKHYGLYVFRSDIVSIWQDMPVTLAEDREKLEQLRAICNGISMRVYIVPAEEMQPSIEIDTPEDLSYAQKFAHL